jgi:hypothetical protein
MVNGHVEIFKRALDVLDNAEDHTLYAVSPSPSAGPGDIEYDGLLPLTPTERQLLSRAPVHYRKAADICREMAQFKSGQRLSESGAIRRRRVLEDAISLRPAMDRGRRRTGRPPKYTEQGLELASKAYDSQIAGDYKTDSKGAWNKVAELHGFPSGDAARKTVETWKKGKK